MNGQPKPEDDTNTTEEHFSTPRHLLPDMFTLWITNKLLYKGTC
jgi:hypothetical protein